MMKNSKEKVSYNYLMRMASGNYLTEYLPEDWHTWSSKKADTFVKENAWEPLEYWDAEEIWQQISQMADLMENCIERYSGVSHE
jgi:hypothetical protein